MSADNFTGCAVIILVVAVCFVRWLWGLQKPSISISPIPEKGPEFFFAETLKEYLDCKAKLERAADLENIKIRKDAKAQAAENAKELAAKQAEARELRTKGGTSIELELNRRKVILLDAEIAILRQRTFPVCLVRPDLVGLRTRLLRKEWKRIASQGEIIIQTLDANIRYDGERDHSQSGHKMERRIVRLDGRVFFCMLRYEGVFKETGRTITIHRPIGGGVASIATQHAVREFTGEILQKPKLISVTTLPALDTLTQAELNALQLNGCNC